MFIIDYKNKTVKEFKKDEFAYFLNSTILKDRYLMNNKLDLNRFNNWLGRGGSHSIYVRQNLLNN